MTRVMDSRFTTLESVLSRLPPPNSEEMGNSQDPMLVQCSDIEAATFTLMFLKPKLQNVVSAMLSAGEIGFSKEVSDFLLDGLENLLAFGYQKSLTLVRSGMRGSLSQKVPLAGPINCTLLEGNTTLAYDQVSTISPKHIRRRWSKRFCFDARGLLDLRFESEDGGCTTLPTSAMRVSFTFLPPTYLSCTGVSASFRQVMRMMREPSISRKLRDFRVIDLDDNGFGSRVLESIQSDDLQSVQRMLSTGELRPWDCDMLGRRLIHVWEPCITPM